MTQVTREARLEHFNTVSMFELRLLIIFLLLLLLLLAASKMRKMLLGALRDALLVSFLGFFLFRTAVLLSYHMPFESKEELYTHVYRILVSHQLLIE